MIAGKGPKLTKTGKYVLRVLLSDVAKRHYHIINRS